MGFSEQIKREVRHRAHLKCCICWTFDFVEVHHIVPQTERKDDSIDNAAPLCVRCHDAYGGNPEKRKWIKQKRDFWYNYCKEKLYNENINDLEKIHETIGEIKRDSTKKEERISELKTMMQHLIDQQRNLYSQIQSTPPDKMQDLWSQIGSTTSTIASGSSTISGSGIRWGVYNNCPKCGTQNDIGSPLCSNCGTALM